MFIILILTLILGLTGCNQHKEGVMNVSVETCEYNQSSAIDTVCSNDEQMIVLPKSNATLNTNGTLMKNQKRQEKRSNYTMNTTKDPFSLDFNSLKKDILLEEVQESNLSQINSHRQKNDWINLKMKNADPLESQRRKQIIKVKEEKLEETYTIETYRETIGTIFQNIANKINQTMYEKVVSVISSGIKATDFSTVFNSHYDEVLKKFADSFNNTRTRLPFQRLSSSMLTGVNSVEWPEGTKHKITTRSVMEALDLLYPTMVDNKTFDEQVKVRLDSYVAAFAGNSTADDITETCASSLFTFIKERINKLVDLELYKMRRCLTRVFSCC